MALIVLLMTLAIVCTVDALSFDPIELHRDYHSDSQADTPFCKELSYYPYEIPEHASDLKVSDLRVIGALGDSFTRGTTLGGLFAASPERVFSIGGQSGIPSMANLLRQQNPRLVGWASEHDDALNVGKLGDKVEDLKDQADELIQRMKAIPEVNMQTDWKLITIFIGANNLCDYCNRYSGGDPLTEFEQGYEAALKVLETMPRTVVNILTMFNLSRFHDINMMHFCPVPFFTCRCVMGDKDNRQRSDILAQNFNKVLSKLRHKYHPSNTGRTDFAILLQTIGTNFVIPDRSFVGPDCFHPSQKAHNAIAINMFNQLMVKPETRNSDMDMDAEPICATESNQRIYIG
eukprot:944514_1